MRLFKDFSRTLSYLMRNTHEVKHAKLFLILVLVTGVISGLSNTGLLALINRALNRGASSGGNLLVIFIGLVAVLIVTRFISSTLLGYLNTRATLALNLRISAQILAAPLRRLEEIGAPRLLASLASDIGAISNIMPLLPAIVINLAIIVGCLIYLAWLSVPLFLGLLGFMFLAVIAYQLPLKSSLIWTRLLRNEGDFLYKHYRAFVEGTKELKLHRGRGNAYYNQLFRPTVEKMAFFGFKSSFMQAVGSSLGVLLNFLPIGLLLFLLPALRNTSTEILTGYTIVILYMAGPIQSIIMWMPPLTHASVSVGTIDALGLPQEFPNREERLAVAARDDDWDELTLSGITHTYYREREDENFTLGPVDLTIRRGELIYLVGNNGSGKTTLAKLLAGLYVPEAGEILLDGQPVNDENREAYRGHFSMLFSDFYLFEELLGLDIPNLDERAHENLVRLQLDHKVEIKDGKLSTTSLSQGQRKRLALLNAFLEDRSIYIFDEWASDQDPLFRDVFYYQLLEELKARGKTIIVISHDDRYYHLGDRLVKLEYGRIEYDQMTAALPDVRADLSLSAVAVPAVE
ncbi:MAG TPA: cyclic peptide export ABC transporter [Pyrinomonadaceae bacterium]